MKIRYGLVLALAILFGVAGCASGGGGGGGGVSAGPAAMGGGGQDLTGINPRNTEFTRAAERALDDGDDADDPAEAQGHYETAKRAAAGAIEEDPMNPLAHRLAALAAMALGEYQEAGQHFDRAAELRPLYEFEDQGLREQKWIEIYQGEASPAVSSGDYETAVSAVEDANAIYSGRPEGFVLLAQLYGQLRQHDDALAAMDEAQAFLTSEAVADVDSATVAEWTSQMDIFPELRASILTDAGRYEEAEAAYAELSMADPDNLDYLRVRASILMNLGEEERGLGVYRDMLGRPNLSGNDYFSIGAGFYQAQDYTEAARAFEGAVQLSGTDRDALEMWARSLMLDSAHAEVAPVAQRWVELDPYSQQGYVIMAQSANQAGDEEAAASAIQNAQGLQVSVDQLQLQRYGTGGGMISGSVVNKTLEQGQNVTLRFTFYGESGDPVGTVTESVTLSATDMAQIFQVEFDSAEYVGGYGYDLTIG